MTTNLLCTVQFVPHSHNHGLRLKVYSRIGKPITYGYYSCDNPDGSFSSASACQNAARMYCEANGITPLRYMEFCDPRNSAQNKNTQHVVVSYVEKAR